MEVDNSVTWMQAKAELSAHKYEGITRDITLAITAQFTTIYTVRNESVCLKF